MARDAVESLGSIAEIVFLLLISSIYVSTRYLETKEEYSFRSSRRILTERKKERKKKELNLRFLSSPCHLQEL